jgi:hypothetical protein
MGLSIPNEWASPDVTALAALGSNVYVTGYFTSAGGNPANGIAKWNGSSWSALGSGPGGITLAASGSNVYVGGGFVSYDGIAAAHIAKWDGASWSALGPSVQGFSFASYVEALAVSHRNVYASGLIVGMDGRWSREVARWNGGNWLLLETRMTGPPGYFVGVTELAISGDDLYAGGSFTNAGDVAANNIAKWNGTNWSALGSGVAGTSSVPAYVSALAVAGNDLYVRGKFHNGPAAARPIT